MRERAQERIDLVVLGGAGMLGRAVAEAARAGGRGVAALDLPAVDVRDPASLAALPRAGWVVNCAAYTNVDGAETDAAAARAVNAAGAGHVARRCAETGARLLHLSTDYVFDGTLDRPYREDDPPSPLNAYGAGKLEGERAVLEGCPGALVVRTQSLFGPGGASFLRAILGQIDRGVCDLRVVSDQVSCPTYVRHLAEALLALMGSGRAGLVHVSASDSCSWYDFARAIAAAVAPGAVTVTPVSAESIARPARRPAWSVLDKSRYEAWTGRRMPGWQEGLKACLAEMGRGAPGGAEQGKAASR